MALLPQGVLALLVAFRIVGLGHVIPIPRIDQGPCPQGRWSQAVYAAQAPRRIGTMYGCGLEISKGTSRHLDPAWITQRARETFVLPGRTVAALCDERFTWADLHHSRATFRCTFANGTITGGGPAVDGRADYLLRLGR